MARDTIHYVRLEEASLRGDALRAFSAAGDAAEALGHVADAAHQAAVADAFSDAESDELSRRATKLKSAAMHALLLVIEIAVRAGRLEELASIREAAGPEEA